MFLSFVFCFLVSFDLMIDSCLNQTLLFPNLSFLIFQTGKKKIESRCRCSSYCYVTVQSNASVYKVYNSIESKLIWSCTKITEQGKVFTFHKKSNKRFLFCFPFSWSRTLIKIPSKAGDIAYFPSPLGL